MFIQQRVAASRPRYPWMFMTMMALIHSRHTSHAASLDDHQHQEHQHHFNNSCILQSENLTPPTPNAPQTFLEDCPAWVVRTTDLVWNTPELSPAAHRRILEEYFYDDWRSTSSWGRTYRGMDDLVQLVVNTRRAFPDLRLHITDVGCYGNDVDGYKTSMTDLLVGTNTGPSEYGAATNRTVRYGGVIVCYVQRIDGEWKYVAEQLMHDEFALLTQLGFGNSHVHHPPLKDEPHDCVPNSPDFGWAEPNKKKRKRKERTAKPTMSMLVQTKPTECNCASVVNTDEDPLAKAVVKQMDSLVAGHLHWNDWPEWSALQKPFWIPNFTYDTVESGTPLILGKSTGLREWYDHEHIPFNLAFKNCAFTQLILAGDEKTATTTTYGHALWQGALGRVVPPTDPEIMVRIRICDFYRFEGDRISYNWMMLDLVDLLHQSVGGKRRVLPPAPLPEEGWMQPPRTMQGIPAPMSRLVTNDDRVRAKHLITKLLRHEWELQDDEDASYWTNDMIWYGPAGFGVARGQANYVEHFVKPLHRAFGQPKLQVDVLSCQGNFCGAHGYLHGNHVGEWLGESATGRRIKMRFGMHWHVDLEQNKVRDGWAMFDIPALFLQMGVNLFDRFDGFVSEG